MSLFVNWYSNLIAKSVSGAIYPVLKQKLMDLIFDKNESVDALRVKPICVKILDTGNVPIGGDIDTLCQISPVIGTSYWQIIDIGDLVNPECIAPVGQSGNVQSPDYKDQMDLQIKGGYKPMTWTREQVELHKLYSAKIDRSDS